MTRIQTANYLSSPSTSFVYATDDNDAFDRNDVNFLAQALEGHDHGDGKGVPVARLASGSVTNANLQDGSVSTTKIIDLAVTGAKIADSTISSAKLGTDSVTATAIAAGAVGASEIVDGGVGTAELANLAVTMAKISPQGTANRVLLTNSSGSAVELGQIGPDYIAGGAINSAGFFADGVITAAKIGGGQVVDSHINNNTIATTKIQNGTPDRVIGTNPSGQVTYLQVVPNMLQGGVINSSGFFGAGVVDNTALGTGQITPPKVSIGGTDGVGKFLESDGVGGFRWNTPSGTFAFPSGYGGWVRQASEIPSGHARESAIDGRIPVGAGTTGTQTFVEGNNYGSAWEHGHSGTFNSSPSGSITMGGKTGAAQEGTAYDEDDTGNGFNTRNDGHTHAAGSLTATITALSVAGSVGSTSHIPFVRAVVWIRKS